MSSDETPNWNQYPNQYDGFQHPEQFTFNPLNMTGTGNLGTTNPQNQNPFQNPDPNAPSFDFPQTPLNTNWTAVNPYWGTHAQNPANQFAVYPSTQNQVQTSHAPNPATSNPVQQTTPNAPFSSGSGTSAPNASNTKTSLTHGSASMIAPETSDGNIATQTTATSQPLSTGQGNNQIYFRMASNPLQHFPLQKSNMVPVPAQQTAQQPQQQQANFSIGGFNPFSADPNNSVVGGSEMGPLSSSSVGIPSTQFVTNDSMQQFPSAWGGYSSPIHSFSPLMWNDGQQPMSSIPQPQQLAMHQSNPNPTLSQNLVQNMNPTLSAPILSHDPSSSSTPLEEKLEEQEEQDNQQVNDTVEQVSDVSINSDVDQQHNIPKKMNSNPNQKQNQNQHQNQHQNQSHQESSAHLPTSPTSESSVSSVSSVSSQRKKTAQPWLGLVVEFKGGSREEFLSPTEFGVGQDDHVIVEADRGTDLGSVVTVFDYNPVKHKTLKRVLRKALPREVVQLPDKRKAEQEALRVAQSLVKKHGLRMKVLDTEFQFDRRKLTLYFVAEKRIDFRQLVRDLFKLFKARIWMKQLPQPKDGTGVVVHHHHVKHSNRTEGNFAQIYPNTDGSVPPQSEQYTNDNEDSDNEDESVSQRTQSHTSPSKSVSSFDSKDDDGDSPSSSIDVEESNSSSSATIVAASFLQPIQQPTQVPVAPIGSKKFTLKCGLKIQRYSDSQTTGSPPSDSNDKPRKYVSNTSYRSSDSSMKSRNRSYNTSFNSTNDNQRRDKRTKRPYSSSHKSRLNPASPSMPQNATFKPLEPKMPSKSRE